MDTPARRKVEFLRMTGRCADGGERDGGTRFHAVLVGSHRALCGAKPGRHSGWSHEHGADASCPRCVVAVERMRAQGEA